MRFVSARRYQPLHAAAPSSFATEIDLTVQGSRMSHTPAQHGAHAANPRPRRRSRVPLAIFLIYAALIGANEWRLQSLVESSAQELPPIETVQP